MGMFDWIKPVLDTINSPRGLIGLAVTSAIFHFTKLGSNIPINWKWVPLVLLIFSTSILVVDAFRWIWKKVAEALSGLVSWRRRRLTDEELTFLKVAAKSRFVSDDDSMRCIEKFMTPNDFGMAKRIMRSLKEKDLIAISPNDNYFCFTTEGMRYIDKNFPA